MGGARGKGRSLPFPLRPIICPSGATHPNAEVSKFQALTHLQKVLHSCFIQDDVYRDPALRGSIYDVLEYIPIGEKIHDDSNDLDREGAAETCCD